MEKNNIIEKIICVFFAVLKRWRTIVIISLICGIAFDVVCTSMYVPQYKASLTAIVKSYDSSYAKLAETRSYIKTLEYILNGEVAKKYVREEINDENAFLTCNIENQDNTNFVTVSVISDSRQSAYYGLGAFVRWSNEEANIYKEDYKLEVIESATYSNTPIEKNVHYKNFILGFMAGLFLTGAYLVFLDLLKKKVRTASDVERYITCRVIAKIPKEHKKRGRIFWKANKKALLIPSINTSFVFKEAFKKFRHRFEESAKKHGYKTILFTSAMENEGKTTIITNLAISLAMKDKKVLLLDLDIIKPSIHKLLKLNVSKNINNCVVKDLPWESQVYKYKQSSLDVIPTIAVEDKPEEFLKSSKLKNILDEAREKYDYVLIDTAPMGNLSDAVIINEHTDASILIIKQGCATCGFIEENIFRLSNAKDNLIGCVYNSSIVNRENKKKLTGYGYNYYYADKGDV